MSEEMESGERTTMPPKALSVALVVSICLNFLAVGALAAMIWRWSAEFRTPGQTASPYAQNGFPPGGPATGRGHGFGRGHGMRLGPGHGFGLGRGALNPHVIAAAVPSKADAIRAVIAGHQVRLEQLRAEAISARTEAAAVLASQDKTTGDFDDALLRVHKADDVLETEILATLSDCARLLTPEERRNVGLNMHAIPR
jgi:uncharacterized membrane protein